MGRKVKGPQQREMAVLLLLLPVSLFGDETKALPLDVVSRTKRRGKSPEKREEDF